MTQPDLFPPAAIPFSLGQETEQDGGRIQRMIDKDRDEKERNEKAQTDWIQEARRI